MSGTRKPRPMLSTSGGGTWSYHPPQSSQLIRMTVESQNGLSPIAFTTFPTQSGPSSVVTPGWSEYEAAGTTQVTGSSVPFRTSVSIFVLGEITLLDQSAP